MSDSYFSHQASPLHAHESHEDVEKQSNGDVPHGEPAEKAETEAAEDYDDDEQPPLGRMKSVPNAWEIEAPMTRLLTLRSRSSRAPTLRSFSRPLPAAKSASENIVAFDGPDDPFDPMNWSMYKKGYTVALYGFLTLTSTYGSASYTSAIPDVMRLFHVSEIVATIGLTLFLFGYGVGPLLWSPLSEVYGRRLTVLLPMFIFICFVFACGTAKDFQTLMLCRFFAGFFGAAPVTNTGAVLADIYPLSQRGVALSIWSATVACGPMLAPIVGGAVVDSSLSWRWTQYLTGIMASAALLLAVLWIDESDAPILLTYKARHLRAETGDYALHAKQEEWIVSLSGLAHKYLAAPPKLLLNPICALMVLYSSFVYAVIYACFAAFPIEFEETRRWNALVGSLPFLAVLVGCLIGVAINVAFNRYYVRRVRANRWRAVPEARLPPMMIGSFFFCAGLFIFAWTARRETLWVGAGMFGAACIGVGFINIFQSALNYLMDTFMMNAGSAFAAATGVRSLAAGCFPLFVPPMFHNLGIDWAASLLGFLALAMIPIPFLFYIYGPRIRAAGKLSRPSTL